MTPCGRTLREAEAEHLGEDEVLALILCRLDGLKAVGCDAPECVSLAARVDVDLEQAVDLVERGIPPELALRMLRDRQAHPSGFAISEDSDIVRYA